MSEVYKRLNQFEYLIGVPSRQRSFLIGKNMGVWKHIPPTKENNGKYNIVTIVRESEILEYSDNGHHLLKAPVPDDYTIAQKRQNLIDIAHGLNKEYLFIIDDDATFYYRDETLSSKYTSKHEIFIRDDHWNKILYESLMLCSEKYPIIGLPLKQGSFGLRYMFPKNIPVIRFVCYHIPTLMKHNIKATGLGTPFMSDRFVHLSLLEKGYASLSNARYTVGDQGTGYRGGCSVTRNVDIQSEAAKLLHKRFPDNVELKWKEDGAWGSKRLDNKIYWKKFLPEGESNYIPAEEGLKILGGPDYGNMGSNV